jgi:hypothetical protein
MTQQTVPWATEIPTNMAGIFPTLASLTIDASGEKVAWIIQAPKDGTIDQVEFRTGTTTTGDDVDVRIETVDAATGDPTGTLWNSPTNTTNATVTIANGDDNVWKTATLTAGAVVTKGQLLAIVVVNGASGNIAIAASLDNISHQVKFPYVSHYTASWAKQTAARNLVVAVRYSGGTYGYVPAAWPISVLSAATTFASNSTPDERGIKFSLPWPVQVCGFWAFVDLDPADVTVKLYDSDGSTVLESLAIDKDQQVSAISRPSHYLFDTVVNLSKDTDYRLTLLPGSTTSVSIGHLTVNAAANWQAFPGGEDFHYTHRTDAGAWTDVTTERPLLGLLVSGFDDGAGGGGAVLPPGSLVGGIHQ